MANARDATVSIIGKDLTKSATDQAGKNFDKLARKVEDAGKSGDTFASKMKDGFSSLQGPATAAGIAVAALGGYAIKSASDAEQSLGSTQTVFGAFADEIIGKSDQAATAVGLSANQYRESANIIGSLLANQGVASDQLAKQTEALIATGADLSAVFGGSAADAVDALSSAFKGEFDPLQRYGITLTQAQINAEALTQAHVDSVSAFNKLDPAQQAAAKSAATMALVNKQAAQTQGQFAEQSGSTAERAQIAKAQFDNLATTFGQDLLPAINKILDVGVKVLDWLGKNKPTAIAAGIAIGVLTIAVWAMNAAWLASPVTWIILAIAALAVGITWVATRTQFFQTVWEAVWGFLKAVGAWFAGPFVDFFVGAWDWIVGVWNGAVQWFKDLPGKIVDALSSLWDKITAPFRTAWNWIQNNVNIPLHNWFRDLPGNIGNFFSGLRDKITAPFRAAFNFVSDAWNNTVGSLSWSVPSWVPIIGGNSISAPRLPRFHSGIDRVPGAPGEEVLAVLEAGERVVPADQNTTSYGGDTYHITVNGIAELQDLLDFIANRRNRSRRKVAMA